MITTFDQKFAELLNNWVVDGWPVGNLILVLIAIVLSVILCGMIGIERETKGRSAGLRTHLLVGVGSCIIMIISIYGFPQMFSEKRDVARLAAQIITGVGFLGAGAIIHRSSGVRGLTTAGTIWIVMAIGIACGSFNFFIAIATSFVIMFVLIVFRKIEVKLNSRNPHVVLVVAADEPVIHKILSVSKEFHCTVHGINSELIDEGESKKIEYSFQVVFENSDANTLEYVQRLEKETNAISAQLIGHR